jgi:hypothetical protein
MKFLDFSDRAGRRISGSRFPLLLILTSAGALNDVNASWLI